MRGPGGRGPRGSAALRLEGPLVGWPGLGVPLKPLGPMSPGGGLLLAATEQSHDRFFLCPEASSEMLSAGGGFEPLLRPGPRLSALAMCPMSPPALVGLPCSPLSHSWGPLLGHRQHQQLWAWMGRRSWDSLPRRAFLWEMQSPFQILPLAAVQWAV